MARFRTKPFEIEAIQFDGENEAEVADFAGATNFHALDEEDRTDDPDCIATVFDILHSTWVGVKKDQWIIRGSKGEYYPCDPEVFAAKYEEIDEPRTLERTIEAPRPTMSSSADSIRRGADWVSDTGGTITSKNDINKRPQQGKRF